MFYESRKYSSDWENRSFTRVHRTRVDAPRTKSTKSWFNDVGISTYYDILYGL